VRRLLRTLWSAAEANDLAEYALALVLIAMTAIAATWAFSSSIVKLYSGASSHVSAATRHAPAANGSSKPFNR
jgi:Flp pilus assembly pilin Flp